MLRFLYKEYEHPVYGGILGKKVFYCATDNQCKKFYSKDGILKSKEIYNLFGNHLEGDTRVVFYAKHADLIDPGNIVVREGNTYCHYTFLLCGDARKQSLVGFWS